MKRSWRMPCGIPRKGWKNKMLCENCKKRTATVFYNENINGKTRSYSLCGECAAKLREAGELQQISSMLGGFQAPFSALHDDLFGGFFGIPGATGGSTKKKCGGCGSTYSDIAAGGRVGCPECYSTFRDELSRTVHSIHGTTTHTGSVPAKYRAIKARANRLKQLKAELSAAVQREDYERAATLRDEVRKLEDEAERKGE